MSAREIIEELPRLTAGELRAIEQQIGVLSARPDTVTASEQVGGSLVLTGLRTIRQAEVEAILEELP